MKYDPIDNNLFIKNRKKFTEVMQSNSIAFFNSNDVFMTKTGNFLPFHQNKDLFYLSGIDQEESVLILFPDAENPNYKEMLFLKSTNEHTAIWEGAKLNKRQAKQISGINTIYWLDEMEHLLEKLIPKTKKIYLNQNDYKNRKFEMDPCEERSTKKIRQNYPNHHYLKSSDVLSKLRGIKSNLEIELIKIACDITKKGIERAFKFIKPDVWEYEIEAEIIYEFIKNKSSGFSYIPIIASGCSACVLHYVKNNNQCKDGELILIDVGANYANYSSDLTRCVPINGRFSKRQKSVYQSVLNVKNKADEMIRESVKWKDYNEEIAKIMTYELLALKLLTKSDVQNQTKEYPAYKKYFMHGISHHLGLDTHDYGDTQNEMKENMVLTVEPGIYIQKEGLGIRLEDTVVVQKNAKPLNLMEHIPIEIEEIEMILQQK